MPLRPSRMGGSHVSRIKVEFTVTPLAFSGEDVGTVELRMTIDNNVGTQYLISYSKNTS